MQSQSGEMGQFVYFGIKSYLEVVLDQVKFFSNLVEVVINIDGVPLFKSTSVQFWPILGMFHNCNGDIHTLKPFAIAIFKGKSKPNCLNSYLGPLVTEINNLNNIKINGNNFSVRVKAIICDAPPRAYIKAIKGHMGYYGYERCTQRCTKDE